MIIGYVLDVDSAAAASKRCFAFVLGNSSNSTDCALSTAASICPVYTSLTCIVGGNLLPCPSGYVVDSTSNCCCFKVFGSNVCPCRQVKCRQDACCTGWSGSGCTTPVCATGCSHGTCSQPGQVSPKYFDFVFCFFLVCWNIFSGN
jgi:hypothetical protein